MRLNVFFKQHSYIFTAFSILYAGGLFVYLVYLPSRPVKTYFKTTCAKTNLDRSLHLCQCGKNCEGRMMCLNIHVAYTDPKKFIRMEQVVAGSSNKHLPPGLKCSYATGCHENPQDVDKELVTYLFNMHLTETNTIKYDVDCYISRSDQTYIVLDDPVKNAVLSLRWRMLIWLLIIIVSHIFLRFMLLIYRNSNVSLKQDA